MIEQPHFRAAFAEAVEMPLHPTQEVARRGVESARADNVGPVGTSGSAAIKTVALHQTLLLLLGQRKHRVLHVEGPVMHPQEA